MAENSLSMLIHAESKAGKSTLTSTAPLPLLVIDAEGSWKFIRSRGFRSEDKLRRITWDPNTEPIPRHDDSWDVCIVNVPNWQTIEMTYRHLSELEHDFKSVSIDSITEMQRRLKANIKPDSMMNDFRDWGQLLVKMDKLIRGFRDLTLLDTALEVVIFIAETEEKKGKWRPNMQGAIATGLPYWVDMVGYVYLEKTGDADGNNTIRKQALMTGPHPSILTGERFQGVLPDVIINPNIEQIFNTIYES